MRAFSLALSTLLVLMTSAPGHARRPTAGQEILYGCRQGECSWVRVSNVQRIAQVPQGQLIQLTAYQGTSVHLEGWLPRRSSDAAIEWESGSRRDYAFCSTERPAYAFERDGELTIHFLDLYERAGYQEVSARAYMRLCHGREGMPRNSGLRRLGYRPGTRSEQVQNGSTETMIRF